MPFQSERISRSAVIRLNGSVEKVFPLFGPVREKEWAAGWEPEIIYSEGETVEEHMIFETKGLPGEGKYTWAVTQYNPADHRIEYTVFTQNRIWFIRVQCVKDGESTRADITYAFTGLTEKGNELNREALQKMYVRGLTDWEEAINYYLKTGNRLETL